MILFVDEVSFAQWGSLSYTWAVRGQQPVVKTKGCRKGLKLFGAIGFQDGQFHYREAQAYRFTRAALKRLATQGVGADLIVALTPLRGLEYKSHRALIGVLNERLGKTRTQRYQRRIGAATAVIGKFNAENYQDFLQQLLDRIDSPPDLKVNFLEYWEIKDGRETIWSWVTDLALSRETVEAVMRAGRTRWKVENEAFNTLKNQGYHLEHNYGHGQQHLCTVLATLMMLAFLVDQVQELGCRLFQAARARFRSRTSLWEKLRAVFTHFCIPDWSTLWRSIAAKSTAALGPTLTFDTS